MSHQGRWRCCQVALCVRQPISPGGREADPPYQRVIQPALPIMPIRQRYIPEEAVTYRRYTEPGFDNLCLDTQPMKQSPGGSRSRGVQVAVSELFPKHKSTQTECTQATQTECSGTTQTEWGHSPDDLSGVDLVICSLAQTTQTDHVTPPRHQDVQTSPVYSSCSSQANSTYWQLVSEDVVQKSLMAINETGAAGDRLKDSTAHQFYCQTRNWLINYEAQRRELVTQSAVKTGYV